MERSQEASWRQRTSGNSEILRGGETVFLRERSSSWLSNNKWSFLNLIYTNHIKRTEKVLFTYLEIYIYVCICMHVLCVYVTTIKEKVDMNLNKSKGIGREEREGGKDIIMS